MNFNLRLGSIIFLLGLSGESFAALNLKESYLSALQTNQGELINDSLINQNSELKKQNQSNYFPKISAKGTYQNVENISEDTKTIGLSLGQSLYKGGRDSLSVDSADKNIVIAENQKMVDRSSLYFTIIDAYYNYFLNLNDYKNLEMLKKQSNERVYETQKRVSVGRSRKGELLQAEAQLASTDALLLNGDGLVKESANRFYLLTGLDKKNNTFSEDIHLISSDKNLIDQGIQTYLDVAYGKGDVKNKELKIDLANLDLEFSQSFYFPTLDFSSNYYFNKRLGTLRNSNWDVGLVLNFPLFEGGLTSARIKESVGKKEQAVYNLLDYKKTVLVNITSRYEIYHRYLNQMKAFDLALLKAKNSYEEAIKDYRLGLVTNLDVLTSLNLYLDSKRNSEKNKIQAIMNLKMLEAASGLLP